MTEHIFRNFLQLFSYFKFFLFLLEIDQNGYKNAEFLCRFPMRWEKMLKITFSQFFLQLGNRLKILRFVTHNELF